MHADVLRASVTGQATEGWAVEGQLRKGTYAKMRFLFLAVVARPPAC
jgi:hypothetical protein